MGRQDAFAECMVGIQLKPSLSLAERDSAARGRASALSLKSFLQTGVMDRLVAALLSRREPSPVVQRGHGSQIALAHIDADDLMLTCRGRISRVDGHRDQQEEALFAPVIPEFGTTHSG